MPGVTTASAGRRTAGARAAPHGGPRSLALSMIMMLEGAFMLSRAARDPEPLRVAGRSMAESLRTAVAQAGAC
ncbi:hypothetical protein [Streptomyces sp. NPDC088254]|uniref:LmrA/YxaF family transcription factor n=1 Tax=Streptomyces sp. NPDC088254 TaxID=3365847 RepID=UPI00380E5104